MGFNSPIPRIIQEAPFSFRHLLDETLNRGGQHLPAKILTAMKPQHPEGESSQALMKIVPKKRDLPSHDGYKEYVVVMVGPSEEEGESCAICRYLEILRKVVGSRLHVANRGEIRRNMFVASVTYKEAKTIQGMEGVVKVSPRMMTKQCVQVPAAIFS